MTDTLRSSPDLLLKKMEFASSGAVIGSSCACHLDADATGCRCDLDHKSFAYVSDSGINEHMLNTMIESIETGKCPHLHKVTDGNTKRESVELIHAATVVGNIAVMKVLLKLHMENIFPSVLYSDMFSLFHLAIIHNQQSSVEIILDTSLDPRKCSSSWIRPALISIAYDRARILNTIMKGRVEKCSKTWAIELVDTAAMLDHSECLSVLRENGITYVPRNDNMRLLVKLMKTETHLFIDILYLNPLYATRKIGKKSILKSAIKRDLLNTKLTKYMSDYKGSMSILLLDCGYNLREDEIVLKSYLSLLQGSDELWEDEDKIRERILCRIEYELFSPKPLKFRCRDVIRRSYSGSLLHKLMSITKVPTAIKRFVLMQGFYFNGMQT